ncbi:hypothetical protein MKX36_12235 [Paenibacillus sp. FSL W8-0439]|uniref:hypothetical protein n=1 Tax=Paenibacillus sp. FSL W8-0439 TaxID=2921716 RepID=UPI0030F67AEB
MLRQNCCYSDWGDRQVARTQGKSFFIIRSWFRWVEIGQLGEYSNLDFFVIVKAGEKTDI